MESKRNRLPLPEKAEIFRKAKDYNVCQADFAIFIRIPYSANNLKQGGFNGAKFGKDGKTGQKKKKSSLFE